MTASQPHLHRRTLAGVATLGLGLPVLAACGGSTNRGGATDPNTPGASGSGGGGGALASTSDVQVGSGTIFPNQQVVVTQPTQGDFKCFTAVCTHQGCIVSSVSDTINCACHGSQYSITDGSVVTGPATTALAAEQISVAGDKITLA
jgi:Rieske Fe-S protein